MGDDFFDPLDQNVEGYLSLLLASNRQFLVLKGDARPLQVVTAKTTTRMKTSVEAAGITSRPRLRLIEVGPILQEITYIHCHGREN